MGLWKRTIAAIAALVSSSPEVPLYHYVIVRADLPLGTQLAQTIHAAGESSPGNLPEHTRAVALHAANEAELLALECELKKAGIVFRAIREPDEPWCGALMAIGLKPQPKTTAIRNLLQKYRLAK